MNPTHPLWVTFVSPYTSVTWVFKNNPSFSCFLSFCVFVLATSSKSRKHGRAPRKISPGKAITWEARQPLESTQQGCKTPALPLTI